MESPPQANSEADDNSIEDFDGSEEERSVVPLEELYMRVENIVRSAIPQFDSTQVSVSCDKLLLEQPLISSESVTRDREVTPHLEDGIENGSAWIQEGSSMLSDSCCAVLESDSFIFGPDRQMEWFFTASSFSDPTPEFPSMVNSFECNNDEPHSAKRSLNFASGTDDEISDCGPGPTTFLLPMSSVSSPAHAASDDDDLDFVMASDGIYESENVNGRNEYTPSTFCATSTKSNLVNDTNHTTVLNRKLVDYDETSSCSDCAEGTLDDHPILSAPPSSSIRTRSVIAKPKQWTRNVAKMKRCTGQDYVGYRRKNKKSSKIIIQDTPRYGRKMRPCCQCRDVKTRSCKRVDEASRKRLFEEFWGKMDWGEKKMFLCSLVEIRDVKQRTISTSPKRSISYFYNLTVDDEKIPVCQKMFCNTFGIHRNTLRFWLISYRNISKRQETNNCDRSASYAVQVSEDEDAPPSVHDNSPCGDPSSSEYCSTLKERNSYLEKFLSDMPKLPSHYCRKSSDRLYLQTDITSMAQLFELYKLKCQNAAIKPMSRFVFDQKCKVNKLSIYTPRKDRCDTCIQFEINKTLSKAAFDAHKAMKDMARAEKEHDKALAKQGLIHVICCDVMKVTLLPITDASSAYYKMKLAMHNFTVYNLANHEAVCYWFCETEANLVASTFASCLVSSMNDLLETGLKDVTIYSDGCPHQNRNSVMSNALLHLSMEKNITINQKYLEKGHTQMEGDSVHSAIEGVLKETKVYLPYELLQIAERARKQPPYKAKLLSYDFFKNYSTNFIYDSIRPGNKPNDPVVVDIRHIQYDPKGIIRYRLNFESQLQELPRRPKTPSSHSFNDLYTNRLPIRVVEPVSYTHPVSYTCIFNFK